MFRHWEEDSDRLLRSSDRCGQRLQAAGYRLQASGFRRRGEESQQQLLRSSDRWPVYCAEVKEAGLQHAADQPAGTTSVVQEVVDAYNEKVWDRSLKKRKSLET